MTRRRSSTRATWPPERGGICRVAGHVGRYDGRGLGAYKVLDGGTVPLEEREIRVYKATRPIAGDGYHDPLMLPSTEQLEACCREYGIPLP